MRSGEQRTGCRFPVCIRKRPAVLLAIHIIVLARREAKICDVVWIDDHAHCSPALFVPAFGKCGTNALKAYTGLHPHLLWTEMSEVEFHPKDITPRELVAKYSPGVGLHDLNIWAIKAPALEWRDPYELASSLRAAYPTAKVVLTMCDPLLLPFRWFRHYVQRTLQWKNSSHQPASVYDLEQYVHQEFQLPNLRELFYVTQPYDERGCAWTWEHKQVLWEASRKFFVGGQVLSAQACNALLTRTLAWDAYLANWTRAGYKAGETLHVVYMEEWETRGREVVQELLRLLQLDSNKYQWDRTDDFKPVFAITDSKTMPEKMLSDTGLLDTSAVRISPPVRRRLPHLCCMLWQATGKAPPWPACTRVTEAHVQLACPTLALDALASAPDTCPSPPHRPPSPEAPSQQRNHQSLPPGSPGDADQYLSPTSLLPDQPMPSPPTAPPHWPPRSPTSGTQVSNEKSVLQIHHRLGLLYGTFLVFLLVTLCCVACRDASTLLLRATRMSSSACRARGRSMPLPSSEDTLASKVARSLPNPASVAGDDDEATPTRVFEADTNKNRTLVSASAHDEDNEPVWHL